MAREEELNADGNDNNGNKKKPKFLQEEEVLKDLIQ